MKKYIEAELEVIAFDAEDIITATNPCSWDCSWDECWE